MYRIRIISGDGKGKSFELQDGDTLIGRSSECAIQLMSPGISKKHAVITVKERDIVVQDLNSSNGTFVNGIMVRRKNLRKSDKISFHGFILQLEWEREALPEATDDMGDMDISMDSMEGEETQEPKKGLKDKLLEVYNAGFLNLIMGSTEMLDWRIVIIILLASFVGITVVTTSYSIVSSEREGLKKEFLKRGQFVAKQVALINTEGIRKDDYNMLSMRFLNNEPDILSAFVIAKDTKVLSPAQDFGAYRNNPEVEDIVKKGKPAFTFLPNNQILFSEPITKYSKKKKINVNAAFSLVYMDASSLAVESGDLIDTMFRASLIPVAIAVVLFSILFRLVSGPMEDIQEKMDLVMKGDMARVESSVKLPALQAMVDTINIVFSKAGDMGGGVDIDWLKSIVTMSSNTMGLLNNNMEIVTLTEPTMQSLQLPQEEELEGKVLKEILPESGIVASLEDVQIRSQNEFGVLHEAEFSDEGTGMSNTIYMISFSVGVSIFSIVEGGGAGGPDTGLLPEQPLDLGGEENVG